MSELLVHLTALFEAGHARPVDGLRTDRAFADPGAATQAAVLIAVVDRPQPTMILTQRPNSMRDHPGQVAFPGGKLEAGEDAVVAALREANEELGIAADAVDIIGVSDLYHTGTGFAVTPVLGLVEPGIAITPDAREVEAWFEAPLDLMFDPASWTERTAMWKGAERVYLDMRYEGFRIWGVTAAIIANLARRLNYRAVQTHSRSP
ncbi:CoA pyrophosphatase [Erythrobacter sp.]|uniref:CoA pyrophosphatase n=1 Tax=Erythrobacter sp. TaxID=1042 RepID=UPI002EBCC7E0|nr:CoA pyrophosphatase [Erythrobacter sp.]